MSKKPKSEFLCDLQYTNYLPDIPFAPKLLKIHLPPQRLLRYCASSLETSQKIPFLTDKLLGMPLDLLHPTQYARPAGVPANVLDPADMAIVPVTREALAAGARPQPTQEELFQQGSSNWLRKQEFQSNNPYEMGIKSFGASDSISKEIVRITHLKKETEAQNSRERQIQLIEQSFEYAHTHSTSSSSAQTKQLHGKLARHSLSFADLSSARLLLLVFQARSSGSRSPDESLVASGGGVGYLSRFLALLFLFRCGNRNSGSSRRRGRVRPGTQQAIPSHWRRGGCNGGGSLARREGTARMLQCRIHVGGV